MPKTIIPASSWQRADDPVRRIAAAGHPGLKADIKDVLRKLPDLIPDNAVTYARSGDWWGLLHAMDWNHFRQVMRAPVGHIGKIREAGAQLGARQINASHVRAGRPVRFRKAAGDEFAFDLYTEDMQQQLRDAQDQLIRELEGTVRDSVEGIILDGAQQGSTPDQIVDDIRELVGLTSRQAQAVQNYRDMLESLDGDALERRLRNYLEDETVQDAIDSGEPLDQAMIDKLVGDYTDNYLDYRAEMIAQTESTRASNYGIQDAYEQAIENGVFPEDAVRQHWKIDLDEKTCPICKSIPGLNPDGVPMGELFDSIDGQQDAPPIHPNCRCSVEVVTDLDQVDTSSQDVSGEEEAA